MRAACTALALFLTTAPALALTCAPPDPIRSFQNAFDAESQYLVVHGRFSFDPDALPKTSDGTSTPQSGSAPARFTGDGLTRDGFTVPLSMPVTLDVECLGPWCGGIAADSPHLAFLERRDDGYHLALTACPSQAFEAPDAALLTRITQCLLDGGC